MQFYRKCLKFVREIIGCAINILGRLHERVRLNMYDDFTIANYFRKSGAQIGLDNRIEIRSLGTEPYLVSIGNHCTIAPDVKVLTHDGGTWLFTNEVPSLQKFGKIEILDNCFIGVGAIIMPNVTIGPNSIVAAGAVVTKSVPANSIVAGNPAKVIESIDIYKEKAIRNWKNQMPDNYFKNLQSNVVYSAQDIHKEKLKNLNLLREHLKSFFNLDSNRSDK